MKPATIKAIVDAGEQAAVASLPRLRALFG